MDEHAAARARYAVVGAFVAGNAVSIVFLYPLGFFYYFTTDVPLRNDHLWVTAIGLLAAGTVAIAVTAATRIAWRWSIARSLAFGAGLGLAVHGMVLALLFGIGSRDLGEDPDDFYDVWTTGQVRALAAACAVVALAGAVSAVVAWRGRRG